MFQKFFTESLMSKFIKNLLETETIPLLDCVSDGNIIIEDCLYIYRGLVIKCVKTGKLKISTTDNLFPSETIYPSITMVPKYGESLAQFKVIDYYNEEGSGRFSCNFISTTHRYDIETHKYLGEYLRYIRATKNIDLMPFYNCFSGYEIADIYLADNSVMRITPGPLLFPSKSLHPGIMYDSEKQTVEFGRTQSRVVAVPIKFGQTYTIAVDCNSSLQLRSVIYNSQSGLIKDYKRNKYYSDEPELKDSFVSMPCSHFNKPFTYKVETLNKELYSRQRNLYLLIQLPPNHKSSIVVLEGNYLNLRSVTCDENHVRQYSIFSNISLLRHNTNDSYAFSDRLVEYLLNNVIEPNEEFTTNIQNVQKQLARYISSYANRLDSKTSRFGVWDDAIRSGVFHLLETYKDTMYFEDQDGYINKDIENLLSMSRGVKK